MQGFQEKEGPRRRKVGVQWDETFLRVAGPSGSHAANTIGLDSGASRRHSRRAKHQWATEEEEGLVEHRAKEWKRLTYIPESDRRALVPAQARTMGYQTPYEVRRTRGRVARRGNSSFRVTLGWGDCSWAVRREWIKAQRRVGSRGEGAGICPSIS